MRLSYEELVRNAPGGPCAVTVGVFDGVHLGHLHLIDALKARARERGLRSCIVTLHPDPVQVLRPEIRVSYVTSLEERIELLRATGVDSVATLTFTSEVAELSAADFVGLLHGALQMRFLLMGPDHAFGRGREGTPARVAAIGAEVGFDVETLPRPLEGTAGAVSSTAIRRALEDGDMERAASLLGRPYAIRGPVVKGHERGARTLGFPTANIAVTPDRALPAFGVYVTRASFGAGAYQSATNIGVNPTFDDQRPAIETYILDFEGDLYGRELRIEVLHRLRPEKRFEHIEDLIMAIRDDVQAVRDYFAANPS
jgi:riboflavin kinase/FMN adenylyltransferase